MSVRIGHLSLVEPGRGGGVVAGPLRPAGAPEPVPAVTADVIPASPPDAVTELVAAAARRAEDLYERNRELHFAKDPDTGRIVVQVRELDGTVVRTIPPSEALDIMSGHCEA